VGTTDLSATQPTQAPSKGGDFDNLLLAAKNACLSSGLLVRLYPQIYTDTSIPKIQNFKKLIDTFTNVQPTENVVDSARRLNRNQPYCWNYPVFIYHHSDQVACADKLKDIYKTQLDDPKAIVNIRPLPASLKGTPGVIEFWLPPDSGSCKN
jgi:hypothetical protein